MFKYIRRQPMTKKYVYLLKTINDDMTAHKRFVYPASGIVTAPDWNTEPECGGGLHGLLNGHGNIGLLNWKSTKWLVLKAVNTKSNLVHIDDDKVKVHTAEVVYCGCQDEAIAKLCELSGDTFAMQYLSKGGDGASMKGGDHASMTGGYRASMKGGDYASMTGGDRASMKGGYGASMTGGDYASMTSGDYASMTGGDGASMIGGDRASMTGGDYASMTGGYGAMFRAGSQSVFITHYYKYDNYITVTAIVDGINIKPDTWYTFDTDKELWVEVEE